MTENNDNNSKFANAIENTETVIVETPGTQLVVVPANRPRKVYAGMWGPAEIGAVAVSAMAVLMVVVAYFFWVVPSNQELVKNRSEADKLEIEVTSADTKYGEIRDTETQVARIASSIDDFEARFLPARSTGQSGLYQRLNGLIASYGLINTSGPDYAPLEANEANGDQSEADKGRSKFRSLYPGVYVTMTLEGPYANLRRFIREIETGREFIVVSAVELAPAETEKRSDGNRSEAGSRQPAAAGAAPYNGPTTGMLDPRSIPGYQPPGPVQQPAETQKSARQKGKTHGETVSLRIELAAYFRRPAGQTAVAAQ
jgi:hypothetical protein